MSDARLLVWHLVASPLAGAAIATGLYVTAVRPSLPWPAWMLDVAAVACGTFGLLAGGVIGFRVAPPASPVRGEDAARRGRRLRRSLGAFGFSAAALGASLLLAGVPVTSWWVMGAALLGATMAAAAFSART